LPLELAKRSNHVGHWRVDCARGKRDLFKVVCDGPKRTEALLRHHETLGELPCVSASRTRDTLNLRGHSVRLLRVHASARRRTNERELVAHHSLNHLIASGRAERRRPPFDAAHRRLRDTRRRSARSTQRATSPALPLWARVVQRAPHVPLFSATKATTLTRCLARRLQDGPVSIRLGPHTPTHIALKVTAQRTREPASLCRRSASAC
jgi:hypothetical protein